MNILKDKFSNIIEEIKNDYINNRVSKKIDKLIKEFNEAKGTLENSINNEDISKEEIEEAIKQVDILQAKIIAQKTKEKTDIYLNAIIEEESKKSE
ncbi:hypothetical protein [Clostridium sp.]|uniref:hypothetical protein n=1 Tax=Clostridium sp. TaxID=1506 RepID=UPI0026242A8B|nr:hypothetical protein [Clostridium sp.]